MLGFLFLSGRGHAAEIKKITLGYSTVAPAGTGLWMAKKIGAFEKHGISADLIFISSGPVVVQELSFRYTSGYLRTLSGSKSFTSTR